MIITKKALPRRTFLRGAGAARIIAGDGEAAAEGGALVFETGDVIPLPTVQGDGEAGEGAQGPFDIDPQPGIALRGAPEILFETCHEKGVQTL